MKTEPLLIAVLGVVVLTLGWRGQRTAETVERLRAQQSAWGKRAAGLPRVPAWAGTREAATPGGAQATADELAAAHARIDALEQDLDAVVDSLNTAIERMNRTAIAEQRARERAWSVGQVIGEPDTMSAGDQRIAWATATADGGTEWLQLGYEKAVEIAQVQVRETSGAGCIAKVAAVLENGVEVIIWQGRESVGAGLVDAPFNAPPGLTARGVKVWLDTARVPDWNEIDAVQLIGRDGSRQWARTAAASSSYGGGGALLDFIGKDVRPRFDGSAEPLTR